MLISTPTTPSLSLLLLFLSLYSMDTLEGHRNLIAKRKRTKRHMPQPPIPFPISANGNDYGSNVDYLDSVPTDEEEEMANCLILLAQGNSSNHVTDRIYHDHGGFESKFTSKRISEIGNDMTYPCRTCERAFPSFQALGGHMASHKKSMNKQPLRSDEEKEELINDNRSFDGISNGSARIHECSICGAEFGSGQALGGHMRRHRASQNRYEAKRERITGLSFDLDLNFPAPASDHERETKFSFGTTKMKREKQDRSGLVLSTAPTLVDCHY